MHFRAWFCSCSIRNTFESCTMWNVLSAIKGTKCAHSGFTPLPELATTVHVTSNHPATIKTFSFTQTRTPCVPWEEADWFLERDKGSLRFIYPSGDINYMCEHVWAPQPQADMSFYCWSESGKGRTGQEELSEQEMRAMIHTRRERQKRFVLFHHMFQDSALDHYLLFPVISYEERYLFVKTLCLRRCFINNTM